MVIITRHEALAAGRTPAMLRVDIAAGVVEVARPRRGVYATGERPQSDEDGHLARTAAALRALDVPAVAGHVSAAVAHRLPVPRRLLGVVTLLAVRGSVRAYAGVRVRVARLPPEHVTTAGGILVTTRARTVVDLARSLPRPAAVAAADAALRAGVPRAELRRVLADCARWPGVRRAREVIAFGDGRAETPIESYAREMSWQLGLPIPEPQVELGDEAQIGRVDLLWRDQRTVGEADGAAKYAAADADGMTKLVLAEKMREERLEDAGFQVVRMTWAQVTRHRAQTGRRITAAFERAARLRG